MSVANAISAVEVKKSLGTLLFYSEFDEPQVWQEILKKELPDLDFRVYPDVGDPDDVRYVLAWKPYDGFFQDFRNLELVINLGAGVDALVQRTDLPDVPIARLSDSGMVKLMCSYVLFSVLRYARDIPAFERSKLKSEWVYIHPRALHQINVGVLGLGQLGSSVAMALRDVGLNVSGWDYMPKAIDGVRCYSNEQRAEFLADQEILVNMLPLTPNTKGLIDADILAGLPKGAKFVNASRGPVVDEDALLAALKSGQISEATLDAFCVEPLPQDHPFWTMDNVLITPHLASITVPETAACDVAESIRLVNAGQAPLHQINIAKGY